MESLWFKRVKTLTLTNGLNSSTSVTAQDHIDTNIARLQKILEKPSHVPNYEIFEDQSDMVSWKIRGRRRVKM